MPGPTLTSSGHAISTSGTVTLPVGWGPGDLVYLFLLSGATYDSGGFASVPAINGLSSFWTSGTSLGLGSVTSPPGNSSLDCQARVFDGAAWHVGQNVVVSAPGADSIALHYVAFTGWLTVDGAHGSVSSSLTQLDTGTPLTTTVADELFVAIWLAMSQTASHGGAASDAILTSYPGDETFVTNGSAFYNAWMSSAHSASCGVTFAITYRVLPTAGSSRADSGVTAANPLYARFAQAVTFKPKPPPPAQGIHFGRLRIS